MNDSVEVDDRDRLTATLLHLGFSKKETVARGSYATRYLERLLRDPVAERHLKDSYLVGYHYQEKPNLYPPQLGNGHYSAFVDGVFFNCSGSACTSKIDCVLEVLHKQDLEARAIDLNAPAIGIPDTHELIKCGDVNGSSFGFTVAPGGQDWSNETDEDSILVDPSPKGMSRDSYAHSSLSDPD